MKTIYVKEINQCGDYFLMKFECVSCSFEILQTTQSIINTHCSQCGLNFNDILIDVSKIKFTLTSGTKRKIRLGVKQVKKMYELQEGKCAYCMVSLNLTYHVEHIIPLCVGGTNRESNLCLSCPECNLMAGTKVFNDFNSKQRWILDEKLRTRKRNSTTARID